MWFWVECAGEQGSKEDDQDGEGRLASMRRVARSLSGAARRSQAGTGRRPGLRPCPVHPRRRPDLSPPQPIAPGGRRPKGLQPTAADVSGRPTSHLSSACVISSMYLVKLLASA